MKFSNEPTAADILSTASAFARVNLQDDLPFCETVILAFREKRFNDGVRSLEAYCRPEFGPVDVLFRRRQFAALISKIPYKGSQKARRLAAEGAFSAAEMRCKRTNKKLRHYAKFPNREPEFYRVVLSRARGELLKILGTPVVSEGILSRIIALSRPGKGLALGSHNKFRTGLVYKLADTDLAVTAMARPYAQLLLDTDHHWSELHRSVDYQNRTYQYPFVSSESCRITYVPKNARTDRTIGVEPALNVVLQLGVHEYFSDLLDRTGNTIWEGGQERNKELARVGSCNPHRVDSPVTVDLKSASDTVASELVRRLFPREWVALLDDLRCKSYVLEGQNHEFQKWSSMGNGYTFVLETLIFLSLARAVNSLFSGKLASVYGDDIIVEKGVCLPLIEVLSYCGFQVNTEKTAIVGGFRESCGADWYYGLQITPVYVRKLALRPTDIYRLLNRAAKCFDWSEVRAYLLRMHREKSPILLGLENEQDDSCLFTSFAHAKASGCLRWQTSSSPKLPSYQNWTFLRWDWKPSSERHRTHVKLIAALRGGGRGIDPSIRGRGTFRLRHATAGRVIA
jgi:hypothetical protein